MEFKSIIYPKNVLTRRNKTHNKVSLKELVMLNNLRGITFSTKPMNLIDSVILYPKKRIRRNGGVL